MASHNRRDAGVELSRIFGCFIVICCHTYLPIIVDERADLTRTLVASFSADGVAVFWLILGFFLFHQKDVKRQWKHMCSHILVPLCFFSLFCFYVLPWINGNSKSFIDSIRRPAKDYQVLVQSLMTWKPINIGGTGHLWYLYIYVIVIMAFPALAGIVETMEKHGEIRAVYYCCFVIVFAINVLENNQLMSFSHHTTGGAIPASMIVILGHFIYQKRSFLSKYGLICPGVFVLVNMMRTLIYVRGYQTVLYWYSVSGIIGAWCIIGFSISIADRFLHDVQRNKVCTIASYTFSIYLFHFFPILIMKRLGVQEYILRKLEKGLPDNITDFVYVIVVAMAVFLISLLLSLVLRYSKKRTISFIQQLT